jgi:3-deoxy-7-phosphoheptulonate synthase
MIAVLHPRTPLEQKAAVVRTIEARGFQVIVHEDEDGGARIGVVGEGAEALAAPLAALPGVAAVRPGSPYPLVSSEGRAGRSSVRLGTARIGGARLALIAGPCAVESRAQILDCAAYVAAAGCGALRGGAFKPRTSPYSFQGLGRRGLELLAEARAATGLPVVTEIVGPEDLDAVTEHADMLQIGARNMQNFRLLQAVGAQPKPVLLKRGLIATLDELLHAAEYVVAAGNPNVVLCERGIRTHGRATRNTLDVAAIPWLQARSHLPVIADPSHACGRRELVLPLALAAVAAGADGLIVETHPDPDRALSDKEQALTRADLEALVAAVRPVAAAVGRRT